MVGRPELTRLRGAWATVVLLVLAAAALLGPGAALPLVRARPVERCDLMVVLGGGALERVETAVDLFRNGACRRIAVTGAEPGNEYPEAAALLASLGPGRRLPPSRASFSTFEDAVVALETARAAGARSVLVITSPCHSLRAGWVLARVFGRSGIDVGLHVSGSLYMDPAAWWTTVSGRTVVLGEYAKLSALGAGAVILSILLGPA